MRGIIIGPFSDRRGDARVGRQPLIVTIDGPAGAGKSTLAKLLSARLGYLYLDTGALYRGVAWKVLSAGADPADAGGISRLLASTALTVDLADHRMRVLVDGQDVTEQLRAPEVTRVASLVSANPGVRDWLLPVQRQVAARGNVVAEGRDMGTRVFPDAGIKFFLDASEDVRAGRRHRELMAAGHRVAMERTREDLRERDQRDRTREVAPLLPATDATIIDTSGMTVDEVLTRMLGVIAAKQ